jgi:hypothetical protein
MSGNTAEVIDFEQIRLRRQRNRQPVPSEPTLPVVVWVPVWCFVPFFQPQAI